MLRKIIYVNSVALILLTACLCMYPALRATLGVRDKALREPGVPKTAWRLYRNLTPRYAAWARARVASGKATELSLENLSGTEWPPFGSVFYLWSVENLQAAWEAGDHTPGVEPRVFARDAIIAASELVIDPNHAAWVQKHWGTNYLHEQDVFYRMLVMAALTSREKLLHDGAHTNMLLDQVESFSKELDASKSGLLDDYPGQCFPGDVVAAIDCVRQADSVLGRDHSAFANRAARGFTGTRATRHQLPPYQADAATGRPLTDARGCANSYVCATSPGLWAFQAREWFALYDKFFWQERYGAAGFREFPKDATKGNWTMDIDAGPVVAGYGVAASAFGVAAARKNGRFDRAYPLSAELLATAWELPNGVLAVPRLLSDLSDAPMLGEAAILWQLTTQPEKGFPVKTGGRVPVYVYVVIIGALLLGTWRILESVWEIKAARRDPEPVVRVPGLQITLWILLVGGAIAMFGLGRWWIGVLLLLVACLFPRWKMPPVDDWDKKGQPADPNKPAESKPA